MASFPCRTGAAMPSSRFRPSPSARVLASGLLAAAWLAVASSPVVAAPLAYVPNQKSGTISVVDTATDAVVRTLDAGGALGKRLQAIDADGRGTLYVVDAAHDQLVAIDPATDTVVRKVGIGEDAEGVRLSPDGRS